MSNVVVSEFVTLDEWDNTVINSNAAERIRHLKQQPGGDILAAGSTKLVAKARS